MNNLNNGENWRDVVGYTHYEVSSLGRIRNKKTNKILLHCLDGQKYHYVSLCENGVKKNHKIHRLIATAFIANPNQYNTVDHIDCNIDNNTIYNLRWCTQQMNCQNRKKTDKQTSSQFKGVYMNKQCNKYQAYIGVNGKSKGLGCFENEKDAARKYNSEAKKLHGEFAKYNIISDSDDSDSDDSDDSDDNDSDDE